MKRKPLDLEEIAKKYKPSVGKIRKERKQIGLTNPKRINVRVMFSYAFHAFAKRGSIYVNPIFMDPELADSDDKRLKDIGTFFDKLGALRRDLLPDEIYKMVCREADFSEFLRRQTSKKMEQRYIEDVKRVLLYIDSYANCFLKQPSEETENVLAHEIDHLDFQEKHKTRLDYLIALGAKLITEIELPLLEESAEVDFRHKSECEARGIFFEEFRKTGYAAEKLDSVRVATSEKLVDHCLGYLTSSFIDFQCRKEAEKEGIKDPKELRNLASYIHAFYGTLRHTPEAANLICKNYGKKNAEITYRISIAVEAKMAEYATRLKPLVDKIHDEYKERLE